MKIVGITLLLALFAASAGAQNLPEWLQGNWSGKGHQVDAQTASTWTMTLKINASEVEVTYPSLKCSGHWRWLGVTEKGKIEFEEIITADRQRACANGERVRVSAHEAGQIVVEFAHPWALGDVIAVVLLNRQP